jgi:tRNA1(Val) A37 N6-methylase TrmN6
VPPTWDELRAELETELGDRITLDGLTGGWKICQRANGHRHSADDVLTADYALCARPDVLRTLDLGAGLGGVGLLTLWGLPPAATLVAVEAQEVSYRLLRANVAGNDLAARVTTLHGDLRELALSERFPLVTGSPPYFPLGTGVLPDDSQKAHARFELRGDVTDYARAAARHLAPGGRFALCFPTPQKQRALDGLAAAGLSVLATREVIPRETLRPLFSLFLAALEPGERVHEAPLVVRTEDGTLSAEMQAVRARFGFT